MQSLKDRISILEDYVQSADKTISDLQIELREDKLALERVRDKHNRLLRILKDLSNEECAELQSSTAKRYPVIGS